MRDAAAGACAEERGWTGSGSDQSEEGGREMVRPRTILIVCLIMMADSRVDKEESMEQK